MYDICVHEHTRHMFPWRYDCNTLYKEKPELAISTYRKRQDPRVSSPVIMAINLGSTGSPISLVRSIRTYYRTY